MVLKKGFVTKRNCVSSFPSTSAERSNLEYKMDELSAYNLGRLKLWQEKNPKKCFQPLAINFIK
mgnify:CR=1 FL=1